MMSYAAKRFCTISRQYRVQSFQTLEDAMPEPKTLTPAYVPFKTFTTVLDSFSSFLPDKIDTSMWPSYSGGMRSQLIGALKFLRLIEDDGTVTESLRTLSHSSSEQRGKAFLSVMRTAYAQMMALDLTKATPASFDAELRKFGQEGETHRKAASFFLQAAKWAGVPLSPLLLKKGSLSGTRRKRVGNGVGATKAKAATFSPGVVRQEHLKPPVIGSEREIVLSDGSKLFLRTEKDLFKMNTEDRSFTMELLVKIEAYDAAHPMEEEEDEDDEEA